MKLLRQHLKHKDKSRLFLDLVGYYIAKKDLDAVKSLLSNAGSYVSDPLLLNRIKNMFLMTSYCNDMFGLGEDIVGTMTNMVFAGNVNIRINKQKRAQKLVDDLYFDGEFFNKLKEAYKAAISTNGESFIFFLVDDIVDEDGNVISQRFNKFDVSPSFEVEVGTNYVRRKFYEYVERTSRDKEKAFDIYEIHYDYIMIDKEEYMLEIKGYDEEGRQVDDYIVYKLLNINTLRQYFNFKPYEILKVGAGMLPNILFIENQLSRALYFQDRDLEVSQPEVYIPQHMLSSADSNALETENMYNAYSKYKVVRSNLDDAKVQYEQGVSAIREIERHITLNVLRGCLDAKISPVSLGYTLTDTMASNTDVGTAKERVSIRLRENHIIDLKPTISKLIKTYLYLNNVKNLNVVDIAVIFDPYITPSIEQMTNTLSKQVQFGIKSRELAVQELNKNELSDEEVALEYERIKELGTQIDYNVDQREQARKGETNILKSNKVEE